MTVYTLQAPLPSLRLEAGMKLKLEAIHPTTGAAVAGVSVSHWSIFGSQALAGELEADIPSGPFMLVPGPGALADAPLTFKGGL